MDTKCIILTLRNLEKSTRLQTKLSTELTSETAVDRDVSEREMVADEEDTRRQNCIQLCQGRRGRGLLGEPRHTVL